MLLDRKEEKLHKGSILAGYDLGDDFSQISYCVYGQEEVETVATVVGTKQYNIPTVLCKKKGAGQWFYGKDAVKCAEQEDMLPVTNLLTLAEKGEMVALEEESYDPIALLTLFLRRSLTLLNFIAPIESIGGIMFTVDDLSDRMVEVLAKAAVNLHLKTNRIFFQSHTESFYYFMLHQPSELWVHQALACEHNGRRLKTYRMECNKRTTPVVVLIEEQIYETLAVPDEGEEETLRQDAYRLADDRFLEILQKQSEGRIISSAYLLGDGYRGGWNERSLQFLCRGRRVFQGNNLFSRGACFGLLEKITPSEAAQTHVYLGKDKLKSNIGMNVIRRGKESYYALLDAGENWYELGRECEFLMEESGEISFVVTPLTGKNIETKVMPLPAKKPSGAPYRRYHMEMSMTSPWRVHVAVTDMGFGELFPATDAVWEEDFEVPK